MRLYLSNTLLYVASVPFHCFCLAACSACLAVAICVYGLRRLFNIAAATKRPFFGQKNWHPIVWIGRCVLELNKAKSRTAASRSIGKVVSPTPGTRCQQAGENRCQI